MNGTTSTAAFVMGGLAIAFTPKMTGKVRITISGTLKNNTINDGATVQIAFGTGTAPANGAAAAGTILTNAAQLTNAIAANAEYPFCLSGIVGTATPLTLGTAVWFDLQQAAVTGGTATAQRLQILLEEIQN